MKKKKRGFIAIILLLLMSIQANAQEIAGNVYEAKTNAPVIGATIESADGKPLAVTDIDGNFVITGLENRTYSIIVRYIGYKNKRIDGVKAQPSGADNVVKIAMEVDDQQLQEVQIGVGRSEGTTSGNDVNSRVPDSYEMPRDVIDLTASKKFGSHWELKLNIRDLLAQKVYYKQFANVTYGDGSKREVPEVMRMFRPGQNIGLSATYKF